MALVKELFVILGFVLVFVSCADNDTTPAPAPAPPATPSATATSPTGTVSLITKFNKNTLHLFRIM